MVFSFFQWVESTRAHEIISQSTWMFAVIESIHLLGLSVMGGALLVVDLRLFGLGLKDQPIDELARNASPWLTGSLVVMILTGLALFISEPTKCYYSIPFWWKMGFLAAATIFTYSVRRRSTRAAGSPARPFILKLVALASLGLWFGVGAAGRWIGFSG